jgi:recombination protein RecR
VVEDIRDIVAIEQTVQFRGRYHVLGGLISPIKGMAPSDLNIGSLLERLAENPQIKEIIFALSTDIDGDTTHFYLYKKLKDKPIVLSTIARGISMGDSITYADEVTLGKSILHRVPLETVFNT